MEAFIASMNGLSASDFGALAACCALVAVLGCVLAVCEPRITGRASRPQGHKSMISLSHRTMVSLQGRGPLEMAATAAADQAAAFAPAPELAHDRPTDGRLGSLDAWVLSQSATSLARAIRLGVVSSRRVCESMIGWAFATSFSDTRAVVAWRMADSLAEADAADAFLAAWRARTGSVAVPRSAVGPFFGVGCSIKECIGVKGMPRTGGSVPRAEEAGRCAADDDATVVSRLRLDAGHLQAGSGTERGPAPAGAGADILPGAPFGREGSEWMLSQVCSGAAPESAAVPLPAGRGAGLIPLFSTNVSELCLWYEADNPVYGRSSNPYDLTRTTGGSSGGEAAVVASAAVPVGVGSDIGGSIRMPAAFCGVFGHKPTGGLVPNTGQFPFATTRVLCTGPIARYAEDLWPMLCVMAGADGDRDAACRGVPLSVFGLHRSDGSAGVRGVLVRSGPGGPTFTAEVADGEDEAPEPGLPMPPAGGTAVSAPGRVTGRAADDNAAAAPGAVPDEAASGASPGRSSSSVRRRRGPAARRGAPDPAAVPAAGGTVVAGASLSQVPTCATVRGSAAWARYSALRHPVTVQLLRPPRSRLPAGCVMPTSPPHLVAGGPRTVDWSRVTVYVPSITAGWPVSSAVDPEVERSVHCTAEALRARLGCGVEVLDLPELRDAFRLWSSALQAEGPTPCAEFMAEGHPAAGSQAPALRMLLLRLLTLPLTCWLGPGGGRGLCTGRTVAGLARHSIPALGLGVVESLQAAIAPELYAATARAAVALRHRLGAVLDAGRDAGGGGLLVIPTHPVRAPPHSAPLFEFLNVSYTAVFNALTFPATALPVTIVDEAELRADPAWSPAQRAAAADGATPECALPSSVQLVSGRGMDHLTIGAAVELDGVVSSGARFGWRPPPACRDAGIRPSLNGVM